MGREGKGKGNGGVREREREMNDFGFQVRPRSAESIGLERAHLDMRKSNVFG